MDQTIAVEEVEATTTTTEPDDGRCLVCGSRRRPLWDATEARYRCPACDALYLDHAETFPTLDL